MNTLRAWSTAAILLGAFLTQAAQATDVKFGDLTSAAPESWKSKPPSNKLRAYEFTLPGADGKEDAELAIFFFGPGGGGDVKANIERWKTMFKPPAGKTADDISKVETLKLDKAKLTYLDITGIYLAKFPPFDPNAKVTEKPDFRRLGVFFDCENGPYFITVTGPAATIERHKGEFDKWLKNFK
jgi:hypothetical protein